MKRVSLAFGVMAFGLVVQAADFTFVGGETSSWSDPDSYSEKAVPSAGDTVTIAKRCVGVVTDANFAFVASLGKIVLREVAELRFDVTGTKDFPVPAACYTTSSRTERSQITKQGSGTLNLTGGKDDSQAYRADLVVNEGNLQLYPNETSGVYCQFNNLSVGTNATLTLPPYKTWTVINGQMISVAGTIHCPYVGTPDESSSGRPVFHTRATAGEISGRLTGNVIYRGGDVTSRSLVNFTGTNNTFYCSQAYSGASSGGMTTIGFTSFGPAYDEPGSLGTSTATFSGPVPSVFLYLGTGEETVKSLNWGSTASGYEPATLDAGAHGGLVFNEPGEWMFTSSSRMNHDIVVTGSNAVECVWNGRFNEAKSAQNEQLSTYIIKRGTGTWRFGHNIRKWNQGVIAVEDGTLKFDSLLSAGVCCALGRSNRLRDRASLGLSENTVPYAFLLGGETGSNPVFEYSGSAAASCETRPIGVKANATLSNGTDYDFGYTNVFGVGEGTKTLTLAGDSTTAVNTLESVTNACGTLSLVKDGAGTWNLTGVQDMNGDIFVKQGTLVLEKEPAHYTWFRVNIPQTYMNYVVSPKSPDYGIADPTKIGRSATYASCVNLQEFALYDVAGNRLNLNLTTGTAASFGTWTSDLAENCAAMVNGTSDGGGNGRVLAEMFNDKVSNSSGAALANYQAVYNHLGIPQYAVSFVMRLANDVAEPVSFDWANVFKWPYNGRNAWYIPYALNIEGSADGVHWTTINTRFMTDDTTQWSYDTCDSLLAPTTTLENAWVSDNTLVANTTGQQRALSAGKGFALNTKTPTAGASFARVTGYGVAPGATLRVRKTGNAAKITAPALTVDLTGAKTGSLADATVDGLDFGASGTLKLENVPNGWCGTLPVRFQNCTGVANIGGWTVKTNGRARGSVTVDGEGRIKFISPGTLLIVR